MRTRREQKPDQNGQFIRQLVTETGSARVTIELTVRRFEDIHYIYFPECNRPIRKYGTRLPS